MGFCFPPTCGVCSDDVAVEPLTNDENDFEIPVKNRKRTDGKYFIIFVVFLTFLVISVVAALIRGDSRRLLYAYDDYGNICGVNNPRINGVNTSGVDYSKMEFLNIFLKCRGESCISKKTCVRECPYGNQKSIKPMCRSGENEEFEDPSKPTFHYFERIGLDIALCWKEISALLFISICFSVFPMVSLRYFAKVVIWIVLIFTVIASIIASIYLWIVWSEKNGALKDYVGLSLDKKQAEVTKLMISAITIGIFTVTYLVIVIKLRNKMKLVAVLFEEASKCVAAMPAMLLLPLSTFILMTVLGFFVGLGIVAFLTSGNPYVDTNGKVTFPVNGFFQIMYWVLLFGFLWLSQFLLACQNLVIAGAVTTWYFKRNKNSLRNPVWNSFKMIMYYHLGSAVFASLILAIVKAIRIFVKMLERSARRQNWILYFVWIAVQCLLACFESLLQVLSKNAYVMIAIYGQPFCISARRAYDCIVANLSRIAAVDGVGSFILLVIELCVSIGVTCVAIALFQGVEGLQSIWIPAILIFLFSYLCIHCFTSVYEMTIETLLICFCEDCQLNDGLERPYFMNRSLMIFLQNSRRNSTEIPTSTVCSIT